MKRLLSFLLVIVLTLSAVALISCDKNEPTDPPAATTVDPGINPPDPGTDPENPGPGTPGATPGTTQPPISGDWSEPY